MKKHLNLMLLLFAFVLPVVVAKLVLENHWYQGGVTNRGQLLAQPMASDWLAKPGKWQLIYLLPDVCDTRCQGALFNLRQVPLAMGAELDRLSTLVLVSAESRTELPDASNLVAEGGKVLAAPEPVLQELGRLEHGIEAIYIADPQGNVMLAYPLAEGKTQVLAQGKDILLDLKRLLKVSKIG
ncbi:hypothetical protein [Photobacterium galatheae]|uniref:Cytochrome oxidase n=1 Tax=Photobacterium galatheae TaxID=1654360 RepID=A0A066RPE2_9GAMM|nr:hypothetical protein [Photobacterium galatheae]KDM92335.1 hypothetical protein EA58_06355 [Photobacterium galatheae]MCM0150846.1 cytochrome oxidase [Photobacterium galatheae]